MFWNISTPNLQSLFYCSWAEACHSHDQWQFGQLLVWKASINYCAALKSFLESLAESYHLFYRICHIQYVLEQKGHIHPNSKLPTHSTHVERQNHIPDITVLRAFYTCILHFLLQILPPCFCNAKQLFTCLTNKSSVLWKPAAAFLPNLSAVLNLQV